MTLQQFLAVTAHIDSRDLRRAMAVALALEVPRSSVGYERFYSRVLDELDVTVENAASPASTQPDLIAV